MGGAVTDDLVIDRLNQKECVQMSRFKSMALGTALVAADFVAAVLSLTASASAAVILADV
jgi:hypothetical protein